MTYKEALKSAEKRLFTMRAERAFCKYPPTLMMETIDFLKTAKEALEKQIPRKPVENGYRDGELVCPYCGSELDDIYKPRFCDYCGQRLDWSE